jgi:alkylation response protein AidB-like acyl-CoA dehydrogenase
MEAVLSKIALQGGEFLIKDTLAEDIFIPEELNEEQKMIQETVRDFLHNEIFPNVEKIEHQEDNITPRLLEKMAGLGLLGTHMPEQYGGLQLDTNTNTLIGDALGPAGAFTVSFAAHIGISPSRRFGGSPTLGDFWIWDCRMVSPRLDFKK